MPVRINLWGHSAGLRIPRAVMDVAGLQIGDEVRIRALDSGDVLVTPVKAGDVPARQVEVVVREMTEAESLAGW